MLADFSTAALIDLQSEILEMIAYGEPLAKVAETLCRRAEAAAPGSICSILRVDRAGLLHPLAAASLPADYSDKLDGLRIGPCVGSCGTAAFRGEAVEVSDIENDPLWADFKSLALPLGLRACWSSPIKARDGRAIGTFAFYSRVPRGPTELERDVVARCTHLCAIAIEHDELSRRMHELAFVDTLTGLPNRASFNLRLEQLTKSKTVPFALLLVDLDHLKEVNDTLGHAGGDAMIRTVAERLKVISGRIEGFRLGGDEFAVILTGCAAEADMSDAAQGLIRAMSRPFQHDGHMCVPFVTVGGALGEDTRNAESLCQNADFALYHGKESNRGGFVPYRQGMRTAITHRIQAIRELGDALSHERVFPAYQPVVRIDTSEIVGVEALARMRTPEGRVVSAAEFQDVLSDPRVGTQLTLRMLRAVAADVRAWLDMGIPFQHVGINVTGVDFQKGDLDRRMTEIFGAAGVPLSHVILEVNESVFMGGRDKHVARAVETLRASGMRVALDDFGTGYASLTHLLSFPVDIIKIDKSFVDRLLDDRPSLVIVAGLIDIARKLDMRVVAEGVETNEQAEVLLSLGCVLGQGYRYARPVPASAATELLLRFAQKIGQPRANPHLPLRVTG
jgi:diguanylate cyclase (GGDEF)-like protein